MACPAHRSCRGHAANASSGASCVEEILVHQGRQLSMGVQADAEPRRDGVTAAFRSKTRRLLPLPRPCRPRAPHSCNIPGLGDHRGPRSFYMENGPLTKALDVSAQHLHSDAQPSSTLSERSRTDAQSSQSVAAPLFCCAHSSAASERAASYTHRVRPWVPRWPSGLSTATLRDNIGLSQRPTCLF